jgi:hypothetical protein
MYAKTAKLAVSCFHLITLTKEGLWSIGPIGTFKALAQNFIPSIMHGENIIYKHPEIVRPWIKAGMEFSGKNADIFREEMNRQIDDIVMKLNSQGTYVAKGGQAVGNVVRISANTVKAIKDAFQHVTFGYVENSLKLYCAEDMLARNLPEALQRGIPEEYVRQEIARYCNNAFGGTNLKELMMTKQIQDVLRLTFLAHGWEIDRVMKDLAYFTGHVRPETRYIRQNQWLKAIARTIVGMTIANMVNVANWQDDKAKHPEQYKDRLSPTGYDERKGYMWDNPVARETRIFMGRDSKGYARYWNAFKPEMELADLIYDPTSGLNWYEHISPFTATKQTLLNKMSPVIGMLTQAAIGRSPSGYENKEITQQRGWKQLGAIGKAELSEFMPMSIGAGDLGNIVVQTTRGTNRETAVAMFRQALEKDLPSNSPEERKAGREYGRLLAQALQEQGDKQSQIDAYYKDAQQQVAAAQQLDPKKTKYTDQKTKYMLGLNGKYIQQQMDMFEKKEQQTEDYIKNNKL